MPNGVHEIRPEESRRMQAVLELYKRGKLSPEKVTALKELEKRKLLSLPSTQAEDIKSQMTQNRKEVFDEMLSEIGPIRSYLIGAGKGFKTVGHGAVDLIGAASGLPLAKSLGIEEPGEDELEAERRLKEAHPFAYGAGEITGEAAPFVPVAMGTGGASLPARMAITGGTGALEGGIISRGQGKSGMAGAMAGGAFGAGAEILLPVVGRAGSRLFNKVMGRASRGALLDSAGRPTGELLDALDKAGMTFDDLVGDAQDVIAKATPGAKSEQVLRQAIAEGEGIPLSRGELTRDFGQQYREQRLLESAYSEAAEPFRQFKLQQSEAVKERLNSLFGREVSKEETGELIKDALIGRRKLLRTEKNALYKQVSDQTRDRGGIPIFTNDMKKILPDVGEWEDLAITAPQAMESLNRILTKYGILEPTEDMVQQGFKATPLTVENFERFRKTLNRIARGDTTDASKIAIDPILNALDNEMDEMVSVLGDEAIPKKALTALKEARKRVRTLKTEFDAQSISGKLIDIKRNGVDEVVEASKIYDKLSAKSMPVENIRKLVTSLGKSGEAGQQALGSLQISTILDLISAGFGTESRKISGVKVFNPIAFRKRAKLLGQDKLKAIFKGNPEALKSINNIETIAKDLIPENLAVPRGSSSSLLDLASRLLATKIPGGNMALSVLKGAAEPVAAASTTRKAIKNVTPEVVKIRGLLEQQFPGIASALGIAAAVESKDKIEATVWSSSENGEINE